MSTAEPLQPAGGMTGPIGPAAPASGSRWSGIFWGLNINGWWRLR